MRFIKTFRKKKTKNVIQVAQVTHTDTATVTKIFHVIDTFFPSLFGNFLKF